MVYPFFFNSAGMFWSNAISCTRINQPRAELPMQAKYDTTKIIPLYYLTCTKLRLHYQCWLLVLSGIAHIRNCTAPVMWWYGVFILQPSKSMTVNVCRITNFSTTLPVSPLRGMSWQASCWQINLKPTASKTSLNQGTCAWLGQVSSSLSIYCCCKLVLTSGTRSIQIRTLLALAGVTVLPSLSPSVCFIYF